MVCQVEISSVEEVHVLALNNFYICCLCEIQQEDYNMPLMVAQHILHIQISASPSHFIAFAMIYRLDSPELITSQHFLAANVYVNDLFS